MRLNIVYGVGPIYWIARDTGKRGDKVVSFGWTRELGGYWRVGKGIQTRFGKYIFQIGLCRKREMGTEEEGILSAIEGRILEIPTAEISAWR